MNKLLLSTIGGLLAVIGGFILSGQADIKNDLNIFKISVTQNFKEARTERTKHFGLISRLSGRLGDVEP